MLAAIKNPALHNLPNGYVELEYIEQSSYRLNPLHTGIIASANTKLDMSIMFYNVSRTAFGCRTSGLVAYLDWVLDGQWRLDYDKSQIKNVSEVLPNVKYHIVKDGRYNYVDGSLIATNGEWSSEQDALEIYLFGMNNQNTNAESFSGRGYQCQIFQDGTLVRDYIPSLKIAENKAGYYDLVSNTFVTGSVTSYTAGPEVPKYIAVIPAIKHKSKNLFNKDDCLPEGRGWVGGGITPGSLGNYRGSPVIPVKPNTQYYRNTGNASALYVVLEDGTVTNIFNATQVFTTPDHAVNARWNIPNTADLNGKVVNEGTTPIPYEPYGEYLKPILPAKTYSRLPEGHTEVTHITSTGTQWIDTTIPTNTIYKVKMKCHLNSTSGDFTFFGACNQYTQGAGLIVRHTGGNNYFNGGGNVAPYVANPSITWQKIDYEIVAEMLTNPNTNRLAMNGDIIAETYNCNARSITTRPFYLGCFNFNGNAREFISMDWKEIELYDVNGSLIAHFIPDLYNNEYGLYDLVSKTFFSNSGTGAFTGGTAVHNFL